MADAATTTTTTASADTGATAAASTASGATGAAAPSTTTGAAATGGQTQAADTGGQQTGVNTSLLAGGEGGAAKTETLAEYTDFAMPEGKTLSAEVLGDVKALAKDLGLSQEQAQKLAENWATKLGAQPQAPAEYTDFAVPEGVAVDAEAMTGFKALAKDLNLSQDAAQRLVDFEAGRVKDAFDAPYKLWEETQGKWQAEIKADPDIGGAKLADNLASAAKVIDTFGGQKLRDALDATGAGNNPDIVRAFVKIGRAMGEGGFVAGSPARSSKSYGEVFYGAVDKKD